MVTERTLPGAWIRRPGGSLMGGTMTRRSATDYVVDVVRNIRRYVPPLGLLLAALAVLIAGGLSGDNLVSYSYVHAHTLPGNGGGLMPFYMPITVEPQVLPTK